MRHNNKKNVMRRLLAILESDELLEMVDCQWFTRKFVFSKESLYLESSLANISRASFDTLLKTVNGYTREKNQRIFENIHKYSYQISRISMKHSEQFPNKQFQAVLIQIVLTLAFLSRLSCFSFHLPVNNISFNVYLKFNFESAAYIYASKFDLMAYMTIVQSSSIHQMPV